MKTCFMFGHADTPQITQQLCRVLDQCYEEYGIRSFLVGSRGNFDCNEAPAAL